MNVAFSRLVRRCVLGGSFLFVAAIIADARATEPRPAVPKPSADPKPAAASKETDNSPKPDEPSANTSAEAQKQELAKLAGTWKLKLVETGGKQSDENDTQTWIFAADQLTMRTGHKDDAVATVKLDPAQNPKHLDIVTPAKNNPDGTTTVEQRMPFIYEVDGDQLKVGCIFEFSPFTPRKKSEDDNASKRPTAFKTTPKDDVALFFFERVPPAK